MIYASELLRNDKEIIITAYSVDKARYKNNFNDNTCYIFNNEWITDTSLKNDKWFKQ